MVLRKSMTVFIPALVLLTAGCQQEISYRADVEPILEANCKACHVAGGEGYQKSGLSMESYDSLMKGTKFGPVIEPGSSNGA